MANDLFLRACRRQPTERTPIWLMRQAGRYMPEYQAVRKKTSFLKMCRSPELAAQVTLQPIDVLKVDAAILFSDLLVPLEPMGLKIEFKEKVGPIIHNPVRTRAQVRTLKETDPAQSLDYVMETVRLLRRRLKVPLIGFAGAPFTMASYMVEGGGSRHYIHTKSMMYSAPATWAALMEKLAVLQAKFIRAQIEAGVEAVQLFDSWVGCLGPEEYRRYVLPYSRRVFEAAAKVPTIHYANGGATLLELMSQAGGDVIGIDWRLELDKAWRRIGYRKAIMGNLDPALLFAPRAEIERRAAEILKQAGGRPGHIFNLGHGILPGTPVKNVIALIRAVKRLSRR